MMIITLSHFKKGMLKEKGTSTGDIQHGVARATHPGDARATPSPVTHALNPARWHAGDIKPATRARHRPSPPTRATQSDSVHDTSQTGDASMTPSQMTCARQ